SRTRAGASRARTAGPAAPRRSGGKEHPIRALSARLLPYLARYRRGLVWGLACVAISNFIGLAQPQVLRLAVDDLYRAVTAATLGRYALILSGIGLFAGTLRFAMRKALIGISRHVEFDLRNDLFAHLESLPLQYYQRTRIGDIMSRATNDL